MMYFVFAVLPNLPSCTLEEKRKMINQWNQKMILALWSSMSSGLVSQSP